MFIIYKVLKHDEEHYKDMFEFYLFHNLQGSQTHTAISTSLKQFYLFHNLQGSQTGSTKYSAQGGFISFIIYKVLKLYCSAFFTPVQFYLFHNLQGSQTGG